MRVDDGVRHAKGSLASGTNRYPVSRLENERTECEENQMLRNSLEIVSFTFFSLVPMSGKRISMLNSSKDE